MKLEVNDKVLVVKLSDHVPKESFSGRSGIVIDIDTRSSKYEPLYWVDLGDINFPFWGEELELLKR